MGKWIFAILFGGVAAVFIAAGAVMAYRLQAIIQNAGPDYKARFPIQIA